MLPPRTEESGEQSDSPDRSRPTCRPGRDRPSGTETARVTAPALPSVFTLGLYSFELGLRGPNRFAQRHPPIDHGATVDGPTSPVSNLKGLGYVTNMRVCPEGGGNPFAVFNGKGAGYEDNVIA